MGDSGRLCAPLSVKVTREHADALEQAAAARGVKVAVVVREQLLVAARLRATLARVIGYFRDELAVEADAAEGQLVVETRARRERRELEAALLDLYGDLVAGMPVRLDDQEDDREVRTYDAALRRMDRKKLTKTRSSAVEKSLCLDLGLPPAETVDWAELLRAEEEGGNL